MLAEIGATPLVQLGPIAAGLEVPILAKCEHLNPGGSVKDRIALAIVLDAERRGVLAPGRHDHRGDGGQHRASAWRSSPACAATGSCA